MNNLNFIKIYFREIKKKKSSILFTQFYQKREKTQSLTQLNLPIVQKEYKKVETFNIFHRSYSINSEKDKHISFDSNNCTLEKKSKQHSTLNIKKVNMTLFLKKNLFPQFQRIRSLNDKSDLLVEERVFSLVIESQNFKECQFTM